jgi:putative flippase GtrA
VGDRISARNPLRGDRPKAFLMHPSCASEFWKLSRFSIVRAIATGVYVAAAMIAVSTGELTPTVWAIVGICASFLVSFFTFAVTGRYTDHVVKLAVSSVGSFFFSTIAIWVSTKILKINYLLVLFAVSIIIPIWGYLVSRFWIFAAGSSDSSNQPLKTI